MRLRDLRHLRQFVAILALTSSAALFGQQLVERGPLGKPSQVLDETGEWTTPLLLVSDESVQIYIPDVTSSEWLKQNYSNYKDRSFYTLSTFTFYKTPEACQINQTNWGLGDAEHLNDCAFIGYRVRRAVVNPHEKSVTLVMAAMIDSKGAIQPSSIRTDKIFRFWNQLDKNTENALQKANALIEEQMKIYDQKIQSIH